MTPAQLDLCAHRNAVFSATYSFSLDGNPIDITGYSFRMQVRGYAGEAGSALISLVTVNTDSAEGIHVLNAAQGLFAIRINKASLAALPELVPSPLASVFSYDFIMTAVDGDDLGPAMQGSFSVYEGVTL